MKSAMIFIFFLLSIPLIFSDQAQKIKESKLLINGYYSEQIIVVMMFNNESTLKECNMKHEYEPEKLNNIKEILSKKFEIEFKPVSFEEFNSFKNNCDALDDEIDSTKPIPKEATKWCGGEGTAPKSYHDLGHDQITDRCCRGLVMCPFVIAGNHTKHGLKNEDLATRSLCSCDREFYKCLEKTALGRDLKKGFFSQATLCIEENPYRFVKTIQE